MGRTMIDFHTHILPGMDDGSKHTADSLKMLRMEQEFGVDTVILTPHFYADQNSPSGFLERREYSWGRLTAQMEAGMPRLLRGAEVQYFDGMSYVEDLPSLCIEGTNLLLLEMPFFRWDDRMVHTVLELHSSGNMRIVLAHIDRYLKLASADVWETLRHHGVIMQVNADFFDGFWNKRKAMSMLKKGEFQLIGSDCHNLGSRKPNWDLVPEEARTAAERNGAKLLQSYGL